MGIGTCRHRAGPVVEVGGAVVVSVSGTRQCHSFLFDLTLVYNPGAAFSFLADQGGWQNTFLVLAVAVSAYLVRAILRDEFATLGKTGAAMIIGGALGNVIDRLIHGHVVDFLLFYWQNWFYPAFNIADSFICVGAVLAVLDNIVHRKTQEENIDAV